MSSLLQQQMMMTQNAASGSLWSDDFSANTIANYTIRAQGATGTWAVTSGQMTCTLAGATQSILTPTGSSFTDGYVETDVTYADDGGIVARVADANNYYLLAFHDASANSGTPNTFTIYSCVGAGFTALASNVAIPGGWTRGTSKTFRLTLSGSSISVSIDGTVLSTVTDVNITAAGNYGLRDGINTVKFDALRAWA